MKKRFLSLFLSVVMALSVFSILPITASGEETQNTYTVAGEGDMFNEYWEPRDTDNDMELQDDGTYVKIYTNVQNGNYRLRVVKNHSWDVYFGMNNENKDLTFNVPTDGSTVKIVLTLTGESTGYVSAFVNDSVAPETTAPEVTAHYIVGTIAPDGWNQKSEANLMTLNGDTYELIITGVKADTYEFKMTTNGWWDPAYVFSGKIESGGGNEYITVLEDNSTVKFTFKEDEGFVRAYINDFEYDPDDPYKKTTTHYITGDAGLCNGVAWDCEAEINKMSFNGDIYEIEIKGVKAGVYEFKITSNEVATPAYGFYGEIKSGNRNERITIAEDNSTVKFVFKESEKILKAYVNGVEYSTKSDTYDKETPDIISKGGYYIPYEGVITYRYYFEMPESWKTFANATACCYWSDGTDNCDEVAKLNPDFDENNESGWNYSYMMRKADVPNRDNIYFIDVPWDAQRIIFNNGIDIGEKIDDGNGNETYKNYGKAYQTKYVPSEFYDPGENINYPDGTTSFDNMIFVVNQYDAIDDPSSGEIKYSGEWKYLHQDGSIDYTKGTIFEQETPLPEKALAKNIKINTNSESIYIGDKLTLKTRFFPNNADRRVTWKSSDTKVATVDSNGVVTGKSFGKANITATTTDGTNLVDTCVVTVKDKLIENLKYEVNEDKKSITITNYNGDGKIKDIVIPKTIDGYAVTDIGEWAFANKYFKTIKFNEGLKTIGAYAFYNTELSSITIPKSVTSIGEFAIGFYKDYENGDEDGSPVGIYYDTTFYAYRGSTGWNYAENQTFYDRHKEYTRSVSFKVFRMGYEKTVTNNGFKYNFYKDGTADLIEYTGKSANVTVPSKVSNHTVVGVCKKTFSDTKNRKILSITIPNTVQYIDKYSMVSCRSLKKVVIPKSVKNLECFSVGGVKYYDNDSSYDLMTNFTIYGYKGSDAEKYAKKYRINFIDMGTSISFRKNPVTIYKTGTYAINPIVKFGTGTTTYKSDNTKVATVNGKGVVTAKKAGKAKITVTNNGVKKVLTVTVKNPYLNKTPKTLKSGKNFTLKINGQVGKAKFTHSKKDIVSVKPIKGRSNQYKVTAKKKGTTTITIKTNGITLKCKVTVK
ncbi:MAG: leucine-rich repeat protein [Ruminococcus sp.]